MLKISKVQSPLIVLKSCARVYLVLCEKNRKDFQLKSQAKKAQWISKYSWCMVQCLH